MLATIEKHLAGQADWRARLVGTVMAEGVPWQR